MFLVSQIGLGFDLEPLGWMICTFSISMLTLLFAVVALSGACSAYFAGRPAAKVFPGCAGVAIFIALLIAVGMSQQIPGLEKLPSLRHFWWMGGIPVALAVLAIVIYFKSHAGQDPKRT